MLEKLASADAIRAKMAFRFKRTKLDLFLGLFSLNSIFCLAGRNVPAI